MVERLHTHRGGCSVRILIRLQDFQADRWRWPVSHRKILIISYLFPPAGGIGVQRALSLAKYLPGCGFEVHVLRANNAAAPVKDPDLLKHLPPQLMVHNAMTPELPFGFRQAVWRW